MNSRSSLSSMEVTLKRKNKMFAHIFKFVIIFTHIFEVAHLGFSLADKMIIIDVVRQVALLLQLRNIGLDENNDNDDNDNFHFHKYSFWQHFW